MEDAKPLTLSEFLHWEARQESKHEFVAGEIVAMAGSTRHHNRLVRRLFDAISPRVPQCDVYVSDMMVETERDSYRPDLVVTCDERDTEDGEAVTIRHPMLVIEVLSQRTAAKDRGEKLDGYLSLASLHEYFLVDSRKRWVALYRRRGDRFEVVPIALGAASVELESVQVTIDLEGLYREISAASPR